MKKFFNSVFAVLMASACVSCGGERANVVNSGVDNLTLDVSEFTKDSVFHLNGDTTKPSISMSVKLIYPQKATSDSALCRIRRVFTNAFVKSPEVDPNNIVQNWFSSLIEGFKKDCSDSANDMNYEFRVIQSFDSTATTATLSTFSSSFTGGAHGIAVVNNINVRKKDGRVISESDLFKNGSSQELTNLLVNRILEDNKVSNIKDLESIGFISAEDIKPNGNFRITKDGITYIFNPYEVACYAVGIVEVKLGFDELQPLLKESAFQ